MLNRINQLFQDSPKNLLSIYFCARTGTTLGDQTGKKNGICF